MRVAGLMLTERIGSVWMIRGELGLSFTYGGGAGTRRLGYCRHSRLGVNEPLAWGFPVELVGGVPGF